MNVQSIINNINSPTTIDELEYFINEVGHYNVEDILQSETVEWTMPKWAVKDDIVFFFHAKTAIQNIRRLETKIKQSTDDTNRKSVLLEWLQHARDLYDSYGGKVFAIGHVTGRPFRDDGDWQKKSHWNGKIYAMIGDICILENPVDIGSFSDFITISRQGAITPVVGTDFERLKEVIAKSNAMPSYLMDSHATPLPLSRIDEHNFLKLNKSYKHRFFLEMQFRKFYVDFLLSTIADKKKIFTECNCYKDGKIVGRADNCIYLNGKLVFVEAKLNFNAEPDLLKQLSKYTNVDSMILDNKVISKNIERNSVIAIDTEKITLFNAKLKKFVFEKQIDQLQTEADLLELRHQLIDHIYQD